MLKSKISGKWFNGVFDGGFHKITGLYIDTVSDIHSNESIWNSNAALFQTSNYGIIKNLYLEGEISSPKGCAGLVYWLGNITARNSMAGGSVWNSYYREDCIDESNEYGEPKSAAFMRTQEFVDLLNSGNETDVWTMDADQAFTS